MTRDIEDELKKAQRVTDLKAMGWQKGNKFGGKKKKGTRDRKTIVREILASEDEDGISELDKIMLAILRRAKTGDVAAFNALMDSGFGKITETVENTHRFKKMDSIEVLTDDGETTKRLTFDVGKPTINQPIEPDDCIDVEAEEDVSADESPI